MYHMVLKCSMTKRRQSFFLFLHIFLFFFLFFFFCFFLSFFYLILVFLFPFSSSFSKPSSYCFFFQQVDLTPDQEEVATFFARYMETDHVKKPQFSKNFFTGFKSVLGKNHVIKVCLVLCSFFCFRLFYLSLFGMCYSFSCVCFVCKSNFFVLLFIPFRFLILFFYKRSFQNVILHQF